MVEFAPLVALVALSCCPVATHFAVCSPPPHTGIGSGKTILVSHRETLVLTGGVAANDGHSLPGHFGQH